MSSNANTPAEIDWLTLDDAALLADCTINMYKASGPGGQHRNKVSSAVRLRHRPTGVTTHGDDSRSQHENKGLALKRLRMEIALQVRRPYVVRKAAGPPKAVAACLTRSRGSRGRLDVGRKDGRFWPLGQHMLDALETAEGGLADAAVMIGVGTSNFIAQLRKDRHLFAGAQKICKRHERGTIK